MHVCVGIFHSWAAFLSLGNDPVKLSIPNLPGNGLHRGTERSHIGSWHQHLVLFWILTSWTLHRISGNAAGFISSSLPDFPSPCYLRRKWRSPAHHHWPTGASQQQSNLASVSSWLRGRNPSQIKIYKGIHCHRRLRGCSLESLKLTRVVKLSFRRWSGKGCSMNKENFQLPSSPCR